MTSSPPRDAAPPLTVTLASCLENGNDDQFRRLIHNMVAFSGRLLSVRDGFGAFIGITGVQYSILISIAHQKPQVTVNKVAMHLHLSGPFVTIEIGKLHKMGLVTKTTNPEDKREVLLAVTPAARKLFAKLAPEQQKINDVLFQDITAREFKALNDVFERLVNHGDQASMDIQHLLARQQG